MFFIPPTEDPSAITLNNIKTLLLLNGMQIDEIDPNRNYWFVRTQGGSYFEEFFFGEYVSIGWDDVPCLPEAGRTQEIIDRLKEAYGMPTRVLNQVYKFCTEIKIGDVVIIPSESSASFAFGYIVGDVYTVEPRPEDVEQGKCPFTRRRKTKWVAGVPKSRIDPKLYAFFRNQQALSSANDQAEFIDRAISSFYIKDNVAHFTLSVETDKSPRANDVPTYMNGILFRTYEIAEKLGIVTDSEDQEIEGVSSRINVQSAGVIELFGDPVFVFLVAVVVVGLFGGKATFSKGDANGSLSSDGLPGLIKTVSDVMDSHRNNNVISETKMVKIQERNQIKDPRQE